MDGLLINTEDIYTLCTNMVLREYGRPNIPWSVKAQLQGRPAAEVIHIISLSFEALVFVGLSTGVFSRLNSLYCPLDLSLSSTT